MRPMIAATATALAVLFAGSFPTAVSAKSKVRHHRHVAHAPSRSFAPDAYAREPYVGARVAGPRDPDLFYPNEIEGGVSGNLSFNNQLRKHSDPLNANGGGG